MAAAVQPERILKDLAELWTSLASTEGKPASGGVLRACSMTLIVAAEDSEDAVNVGQTVAELMHEHPSRAIVLKPAPAGDPLDARVFAQCWMPFGSRQQICCEEIEITTPEDSLDQVSRVILGLLAPDLPAVLWCRGERWFERRGFERLYPLIDKLVFDTCGFRDSGTALDIIGQLRSRGPQVGDLAWARLTGWREMIANAFEGTGAQLLDRVSNIAVEYYGERPALSVLYLGAWLQRALPKATLSFRKAPGAEGHIAGVEVSGENADLVFRRVEGDTVHVTGSAHLSAVVLPHASDYRAMHEELTITGRDRVFEEVYRKAVELRKLGA